MKKAAEYRSLPEDAQDMRLAMRLLKNPAKTHSAEEVKRQLGPQSELSVILSLSKDQFWKGHLC